MRTRLERHSGILMHISSLPSPYGIGDLGKEAYEFADLLAKGKIDHWQILPLGPTGYGNSPYAARSTFAGNELFIDLRQLVISGYLSPEDLDGTPEFPIGNVDYAIVEVYKYQLLKKAALEFMRSPHYTDTLEFSQFVEQENFWLDDYALFMTIYEIYNDARWFSVWNREHGERNPGALNLIRQVKAQEIEVWKVMQYFFHSQWKRLRTYVNALGIKFIGDIPIFVAADSVDTWSNLHYFKTDGDGHYSAVSGVPPDFFSQTGQLWGNPVYDWKALANDNYDWWIKRIKKSLELTDILRIDHFRGFEAYWEVPYGERTAEHGTWVKAPGVELFNRIKNALGSIPIIAEDLGVLTPSVENLRDSNGFPGMKICQFGFGLSPSDKLDSKNDFLPHNYGYPFAAYTGTHDNDTTLGWFNSIDKELRKEVCRYLRCSKDTVVWEMIRSVIASHAQYAIIPMQDILELDSSARMNTPSTCGPQNWSWRLHTKYTSRIKLSRLTTLLELYGRTNEYEELAGWELIESEKAKDAG
jgi:4-alpha-glucanotransferase